MKVKKALVCGLLSAMMSVVSISPAWAAKRWVKDGDRYRYDRGDGEYYNDEVKQIDRKFFYGFDAEGYRVSGWGEFQGKRYYFSPEDGIMVMGWVKVEDKWYYLDPKDGHVHFGGPEEIDGKLYYFRWDNGAMRQNEIFCDCDSDDGKGQHGRHFYQATEDGSLMRNTEEYNPNDSRESVRYDERGCIVVATNGQNSWFETLLCRNNEHVKNR